MSAMSNIYTIHECDSMTENELAGLDSLMNENAGPLRGDELAAMFASPVLREWCEARVAEPVESLATFLGELRDEILATITAVTP